MTTHLVAWAQSIDTATLAAITNVTDDVLTRSGTLRYFVPGGGYNNVRWAIASGPNITRAQIVAPSLGRRRANAEIAPRKRGASTLSLGSPELFIPKRPLVLDVGEELEADVAEDAAGASQLNVLVALGLDPLPPMPDGDIRPVRATGTATLTAFAWTSVSMTLDTSLEAGVYTLVGFVPISSGIIAARARIRGQIYRPGMPGLPGAESAAADFEIAGMQDLMGYNMGTFGSNEFPEFQFFSSTADTSETLYAYVIR